MLSLATFTHQLWIAWLSAIIGGIGLGLGYITPVSTLIKWFPDRVGMATGMAVGGFGGGCHGRRSLAQKLIGFFGTETSVGLWQRFCHGLLLYGHDASGMFYHQGRTVRIQNRPAGCRKIPVTWLTTVTVD